MSASKIRTSPCSSQVGAGYPRQIGAQMASPFTKSPLLLRSPPNASLAAQMLQPPPPLNDHQAAKQILDACLPPQGVTMHETNHNQQRPISADVSQVSAATTSMQKVAGATSKDVTPENATIMNMWNDIRAKLDNQAERANDIATEAKADRAELAVKIDASKRECKRLDTRITAAVADTERLDTRVESIEASTAKMEDDIEDHFERLRRERDVTLIGVPRDEAGHNVNLTNTVLTIAAAIGACEIKSHNIEFVRKASDMKNGSGLLITRFDTKRSRDYFYNSYMADPEMLSAACFGYDLEAAERIYVSDNLTHRNAEIRKRAVYLKKRQQLKIVSIREGLVHVTLNADPERMRRPIKSVFELEHLAKSDGTAPDVERAPSSNQAANINSHKVRKHKRQRSRGSADAGESHSGAAAKRDERHQKNKAPKKNPFDQTKSPFQPRLSQPQNNQQQQQLKTMWHQQSQSTTQQHSTQSQHLQQLVLQPPPTLQQPPFQQSPSPSNLPEPLKPNPIFPKNNQQANDADATTSNMDVIDAHISV